MSNPVNHHYVPASYLNLWGNPLSKAKYKQITAYGFYSIGKLGITKKSTKKICSQDHLYTRDAANDEDRFLIEKKFFSRLEDEASKIIRIILDKGISNLSAEQRYIFTMFFLGLEIRSPKHVEKIKKIAIDVLHEEFSEPDFIAKYPGKGIEGAPSTPIEWMKNFLPEVYNNFGLDRLPTVIAGINNDLYHQGFGSMFWFVIDFSECFESLLTSDNPVFQSSALSNEGCVCALPLGPKKAFFAVKNVKKYWEIIAAPKEKIINELNVIFVSQADKWVVGQDKSQKDFVKNNFGTRRKTRDFKVKKDILKRSGII